MTRPRKTGAGDFPFRMKILRDVGTTQDAMGNPVSSWQTFADVWAGEEMTAGREIVNAQQTAPDTSSVITTRYVSGVRSDMRIQPATGSNRTLEIIAAINKGSFNVELELWCKEAL